MYKVRARTECSSSLTSSTVPSSKVHFTISVSGEAPMTCSLLDNLVQKLWKSCSLIRCQTCESWAWMTADSVTEVEVGMLEDMMLQ